MSEEFHANAGEVGYFWQQPNRLPQSQSVPEQMHNLNTHLPHFNASLECGATSILSPAKHFFVSFLSAAQIADALANRVQIGIGLGNPGGEDLMMQKNSRIRTESHWA